MLHSVPRRCSICPRPAVGINYGALSCDSCKMFFRRTVVLDLVYRCTREKMCFENLNENSRRPHCKLCRFHKCMKVGMFIKPSTLMSPKLWERDTISTALKQLHYLNTKRTTLLMSKCSYGNPRLEDMVRRENIALVSQDPNQPLKENDWRFIDIITTIEFLLNLDFMEELDITDQMVLLRAFASKAILLFTAFSSMEKDYGQLMTPGGHEIVSEALLEKLEITQEMANSIKSRMIGGLSELSVTEDELLLIIVIFFLDPVITVPQPLSSMAVTYVASKRQMYSQFLLEHCQLMQQDGWQKRLPELYVLCHTLNRNMREIDKLNILAKLKYPTSICKKLYDDITMHRC
ncbi:hypothetical protein B9Z55_022453 [Caenorhabditis nigoni]|uniref:NR LBD domain-containing protein n=3 Tax=Caenorhabditis nigoni TaxID=1611254 RepID=A0A2G5SK75_9PELO|nr:hypothetical protein B9Z55_022453 [Caenorhabditis nigoni]